jgi:hypothetical protein
VLSPLALNAATMETGTDPHISVSNYPVFGRRNSRGRIHRWSDEPSAYNPAPALCIAIIKVG